MTDDIVYNKISYLDGDARPFHRWTPKTIFKDRRIGQIENVIENDSGYKINIKFDSSEMTKRIDDLISTPILSAKEARSLLGIETDADLFPEMRGVKGMRWGAKKASSTIKENHVTVKLKTPSRIIMRKDLNVAMRLMEYRQTDEMLNAIAIVQQLKEGQQVFRVHELKAKQAVGRFITVPGTEIVGTCTDMVKSEYSSDPTKFVIDGKLETLGAMDFVVLEDSLSRSIDGTFGTIPKD